MSGKNPIPTRDPQIYEGTNIIVPFGGTTIVKGKRDPTANDKKYPISSYWVNTATNTVFFLTSNGTWVQVVVAALGGLTLNGVLIGQGSAPIIATAAGTNGQLLIGATSAAPAFGTVTSTGSTLTYTTGANTLNIDITAPVTVPNGGTGRITLTNHGVLIGAGTSAITQSAVGATGTVLAGNTGADPTFQALTDLNVVDVTGTSQAMAVGTTYIADNAGLVTLTLPSTAAQGTIMKIIGNGAGGWSLAQNASQNVKFNGLTTTTGTGGSMSSTNRYNCVTLFCTVANTTWVVANASGSFTFV